MSGQAETADAGTIAVPAQDEWADAKKIVQLSNGIKLAYSEMGDSSGPPLLLIHGYTDSSRGWSLIAPYLVKYHIYAVDLRGHGRSDAPQCCYALTDFANDVSLFLTAMGLKKTAVVGHSLGSLTAQVLTAQHPEQVSKAVLISSTVTPGGGPGTWLWDNVMPAQASFDPDSKFMIDWWWSPTPLDPAFLTLERHESAAIPLHVWKGVEWGLTMAELSKIAPVVKAPIMIFWGDQDPLFDAAHQAKLKAAYPQARYETFEGAGHNMFWERPQQAAALIDDFLGDSVGPHHGRGPTL